MIWTYQHEGPFNGQDSIRVTNRRGEAGLARIKYFPACRLVGPVLQAVERDEDGYPTREPQVVDRRPTFRNA